MNVLRKIVHQVGFIYKFIAVCLSSMICCTIEVSECDQLQQ